MEAFGEPACDEANEPLVPILGVEKEEWRFRVGVDDLLGAGKGLFEHVCLDGFALGVECFKLGGDSAGLDRIFGGKEPCTKPRGTDPAARIDVRPEDEAETIAGRRLVQPSRIGECAQTCVVAQPQNFQALGHECPVDAAEWYDATEVISDEDRVKMGRTNAISFWNLDFD